MKIESKTGKSSYPAKHIYDFVTDFRNFNNFIPANSVSNWQAGSDKCTFSMDLLGNIALSIAEKEKDKMVKIVSDPAISQYNFNLWIQLVQIGEADTRLKVTIEPLLNQILLSMVKGNLKKFVDSLVEEIEKFEFPS